MNPAKITPQQILAMKGRQPIPVLTCYDFPMAKLLDELAIPILLVGDSLGMVVLGYPDTTFVTTEEMEHHVRAVARAKTAALVVADLPYHSYRTVEEALATARRLMAAGADAVKAEGGKVIEAQVRAIVGAGIPFMGHLGMLPQSLHEEGGYHLKGKLEAEKAQLIEDGRMLAAAGAFSVVLELVAGPTSAELTRQVSIPTIGIAAGRDCDGQVLVTPDLLGTTYGYIPKHVRPDTEIPARLRAVIAQWRDNVGKKP